MEGYSGVEHRGKLAKIEGPLQGGPGHSSKTKSLVRSFFGWSRRFVAGVADDRGQDFRRLFGLRFVRKTAGRSCGGLRCRRALFYRDGALACARGGLDLQHEKTHGTQLLRGLGLGPRLQSTLGDGPRAIAGGVFKGRQI